MSDATDVMRGQFAAADLVADHGETGIDLFGGAREQIQRGEFVSLRQGWRDRQNGA